MGHFLGPTVNPISSEGFFVGSQLPNNAAKVWTQLVTGFENDGNSFSFVAYLNGQWVISGDTGTGHVVFVATNGISSWVKHSVGTTATSQTSVGSAFGDGTYVYVVKGATGAQPLSFTSTDLSTWTRNNTGFANGANLGTPVFGNGVFLLVQRGGTDYATSPDGATWTHQSTYVPHSWLGSVIFDGTQFVALVQGVSSTLKIAVSPDGVSWTESSATLTVGSPIAVANRGTTQYVCGTSTPSDAGNSVNGALTTVTAVSFNDALHATAAIAFGVANFARCNMTTNGLQSSSDGITWKKDTTPSGASNFNQLGYGAGRFIAVGAGNSTNNFAAKRNV